MLPKSRSRLAMTVLSLALLASPAYAAERMVSVAAVHSAQATMDKLEAIAQARGLKIFARIDHAAGALSIGQGLRPTQLLVFGQPKGGTPVLQCVQTMGLDLPLRVLAWEDATGKSWLGYQALSGPGHTQTDAGCDAAFKQLNDTLDALVREAARA